MNLGAATAPGIRRRAKGTVSATANIVRMRRVTLLHSLLGLVSPLLITGAATVSASAASQAAGAGKRHIGHVWTIVLENEEFEQTFAAGRTAAPYLTQTLVSKGELIVQYFGTGHSSFV